MDAIIVPFSAVGISDSVNILLDQNGTCHAYILKDSQHKITCDCITSAYLSALSIVLSLANRNTKILLDIRQIPFMKERTMGSGMPSARAGVVEDLLPPLFVPKAPERNYFLFGQVQRNTTLHNTIQHYTTLHYTIQHYTTLHYTTLHYTTLHYTTLHYTTLHYTTQYYTTLHYTTLHYTTLHYTTLHYTALHCTTLHYTTLHYTTLHYTIIHDTILPSFQHPQS